MSEQYSGTQSGRLTTDLGDAPIGYHLPRRVMRERRETEQALALVASDWGPSWTVVPAPSAHWADPLYDDAA